MSGAELLGTGIVPLVIAAATGTFAARAIPLLVPGVDHLSPAARAYLRAIGPAALGGIAATEVLVHGGSLHFGPEVVAVAIGALVGRMRGSLLLAMLASIVVVLLLRATIFA